MTARGDEHRIADILDAAAKLSARPQVPYETWRDAARSLAVISPPSLP